MKEIDSDFTPSLWHPFYFVRSGLKNNISRFSSHLTGKLMDFGCGTKPYKSLLSVQEYIGVDFENEGHPHDNEQIDIFYDGKTIPLEDAYFDSILCSEVFEHIFNLEEVVRELNRVLKIKGKMLITCPFVWNEHEVPHDYARYSKFALKELLERNGFEIIEYRKSGNFVTVIFQMITLYFFSVFKGIWRKFFLFRWLYKFFFFFLSNCLGIFFSRLLVKNTTLYLTNILVVQKINI